MTKELLANTKRKLAEFNRWRAVASFAPLYLVDCLPGYRLPLFEFEELANNLSWWQQLAPYEVNEIIKTLNQLPDRQRAILVMSFICPFESCSHCDRLETMDIMAAVGVKKSRFYDLKHQALLSFAKSYRKGWLIDYTDQREQRKSGE